MRNFIKNHIVITNAIFSYSEGAFYRSGADLLLVGSDQIWRPEYNDFLEDMYGAFIEHLSVKRIAYGASWGIQLGIYR